MKTKTMIVAFVAAMLIAACATTAPQSLSPAQVISIACPPIQAAITQFEAIDATLPGVPAAVKAEADLQKLQPVVTAACASGATVSTASVQAFAQSVLPVLGQIAGSLPLPPAQLAQVQAGLVAAEIAVGAAGVVEQQIQAAKTAAVATPAS
ncbi:MAG: hypothetical protein WAM90_15750 [Rhodanobacter sp.]